MTTLVTPATIVSGSIPPADDFNSFGDALLQLQGGVPAEGALDFFTATQTVAQTGLTASTFVSLTFSGADIVDAASGHDPASNNTRYGSKTPGYHEIGGCGAFLGSASGARRLVRVAVNGTVVPGSLGSGAPLGANDVVVSLPSGIYVYLNGTTDYVEIQAFADYASWATRVNAETASRLSVRWVHS